MKELTKLEDTIELMLSDNHYDRLIAEYYQLRIRCQKLYNILYDCDKELLSFTPKTPIHILKEQYAIMNDYLLILNQRLHIEE